MMIRLPWREKYKKTKKKTKIERRVEKNKKIKNKHKNERKISKIKQNPTTNKIQINKQNTNKKLCCKRINHKMV